MKLTSAQIKNTSLVAGTTITDALNTKQGQLVSGVNLKTINSESLLGNGNIIITGRRIDIPLYP